MSKSIVSFYLIATKPQFSFYKWQQSYWKRRGIPGPDATLFFGNMHELTDVEKPGVLILREWTKVRFRKQIIFTYYTRCFQKYGKVYGFQEGIRKTLVISDPNMLQELFIKKFDDFYGRKNMALVGDLENDRKVHVFEARGVRWKRLRSISNPTFTANSLKKIRNTVEDSAIQLLKLMEINADKEAFNIHRYYQEYTLDVISRIAMGEKESKMFQNNRIKLVQKFFLRSFRNPIFYLASIMPIFHIPLRRLFIIIGGLKELPILVLMNSLTKTVHERIEKRAKDIEEGTHSGEPEDFIDLFLDARTEEKFDNCVEFSRSGIQVTKSLTTEEIVAQCLVFLLAGFDTTANSLAYTSFLLAKHPEVMRKLQDEIDICCTEENINYETLNRLKYMDCVIKESLRIYPLASFASSRRCMRTTTLGEVEVREGEFVMADTWTVHYDKTLWGDDANEFRPERLVVKAVTTCEFSLLAEIQKYKCFIFQNELKLIGSTTISPKEVTIYLQKRSFSEIHL
uniref:Cytochrome P450 n=1 Tax=Heterorhabditis bacteriophora TaxID=37862 RepID=A0A1I7WLL2_HETBA